MVVDGHRLPIGIVSSTDILVAVAEVTEEPVPQATQPKGEQT